MAAIDTGARVRATIADTITKQCFGEAIEFDVFPGVDVQDGRPVITYTMTFAKRSPIIGQGKMLNVSAVTAAVPTDEAITNAVANALRELRELSAKLVASPN